MQRFFYKPYLMPLSASLAGFFSLSSVLPASPADTYISSPAPTPGPAPAPARERFEVQVRINQGASVLENAPLSGKAHATKPSSEAFKVWLSKYNDLDRLSAAISRSDRIVNVKGQWDHADKALASMGFACRQVKDSQIDAAALQDASLLIVNCGARIDRSRLPAIRDFVGRGGYLLSTDWALDGFLANTFPGYIRWNKGVNRTDIYDSRVIGNDSPLYRGLVRHAWWKLDESSHLVAVSKPQSVKILVQSARLAGEDPSRQGIMACAFPFGKGYVLHMVGHFDNNGKMFLPGSLPDPAPEMGIGLRQGLAANFVVSALLGENPL